MTNQKDFPAVGTPVRITKGTYSGCEGIVMSVTGNLVLLRGKTYGMPKNGVTVNINAIVLASTPF